MQENGYDSLCVTILAFITWSYKSARLTMPLIAFVTPKKVQQSINLASFLPFQEEVKPLESYHRSQSFTKYIDILGEDAEDKENIHDPITDTTLEIDEQICDDVLESQAQLTLRIDNPGVKRKRSFKDLKFINSNIKRKTPESELTEPTVRPNRRSFSKQISEYIEEKSEQTTRKLTRSTSLFNLRRSNSEVNLSDELISVRSLTSRHDKNELSSSTHFRLETYNVRPVYSAPHFNVNPFKSSPPYPNVNGASSHRYIKTSLYDIWEMYCINSIL